MSETASVSTGGSSTTSQASSAPSQSAQSGSASTSGNFSQSQSAQHQSNPNPNASGKSLAEGQVANQTPQEQSKPEPRRLGDDAMDALVTVKINGKTQDLPLKEVIKLQQLEQASHEKMRQAAEAQRRAQELLQLDIDRFAEMRGLDLDSLAEERLAKKYELMQMTPEQRRLHDLEQREAQRQEMIGKQRSQLIDQIKQYTTELPPGLENASPEQVHAFLEQTKQVYAMTEQNLEREILGAWKETGLPKHKYFGSLMAFHMMHSKNSDGTPLQAAQAASKVKQEFGSQVREILGTMDAQAIHEFLGKDMTNKLREYDVQRVTAQQAASAMPSKSPGNQTPASEPKKYLNQIEWRKAMGLV